MTQPPYKETQMPILPSPKAEYFRSAIYNHSGPQNTLSPEHSRTALAFHRVPPFRSPHQDIFDSAPRSRILVRSLLGTYKEISPPLGSLIFIPNIMLAQPQTRQHLHQNTTSTLPSPPSSQQLSFDQLSQQLSAQEFFNRKLLHDYLESQQQSLSNPAIVANDPNPFMTNEYDFSNPTIRIQQSTPVPQHSSTFSQTSMLQNGNQSGLDSWNTFNNVHSNGQSLQTPVQSQRGNTHQRAASSSSIASSGSHYQAIGSTAGYPYVAHSENLPSTSTVNVDSSYSADEPSRTFSNHHLPTPTHTPTQDSFMNSGFNYNDSTMAAHMSMKQALMDQHVPDEDVPGFGHSARHSVSSYGRDSPATPHTAPSEDVDEKFKMPPSGMTSHSKVDSWLFDEFLTYDLPDLRHTVPKFERTYTDVALDTFYDPNTMVAQTQSIPHTKAPSNSSLLSPYRSNTNDVVQRTLQRAQNARSQSPSSSISRGVSPFRRDSPYQPSNSFNSPRMRVGTAAQTREQDVKADPTYAMKNNSTIEEPKTISPKDALLDYRDVDDESKVSLFPGGGVSEYDHQYHGSGDQYRNATQSSFDTTSAQSYRKDSWATPQFSPNFPTSVAGPSQSSTSFNFAPPAISGNLHGLPFGSSQYRTHNNMPSASEQVPEFPAHLTSMESSVSEAGPESSQSSIEHLQKPASSNADTGTYTCTYHGCTLRFETPQKLQKHKREGHRNATTVNIPTASSMTSAALLERNSQAGPHKCERINPTTGKPCNTIFSRPYDLTRHEDTIHNARKQKVRCVLCVEEKTFSRNDALTRHMVRIHQSSVHKSWPC
jgi:hypothetical protein